MNKPTLPPESLELAKHVIDRQRNLTPKQAGELLSASFVLASSIKISYELVNGDHNETRQP